ncbi:MAG: hypothetical protein NC407_13340 [Lachnoclostridium sp.]|nr:hypothetical protein [Lachnoclostridium sp.]
MPEPGLWLGIFKHRHIEILYYTLPRVSTDFSGKVVKNGKKYRLANNQ